MANEYLRLNDTQLNIRKAENLLAIIESKRKDAIEKKEIQSENSLFSELFKAFKDFFSKLGKPTIQKKLLKKESPARSKDYNDRMTEVHDDMHVAYAETDSLASVIVKDFNYSEVERQMLLNKVKKLSSDTTDYSFYSVGAKTQSIYAVDSFTDNSKVDYSLVTPGIPAAELVTTQGVVTLKRTGNIDRNPDVLRVAGIQESLPAWDAQLETGGYEGLYFGVKNEPRPEGGRWHVTYSQDGTRLYEHGASEDELMPRRLQMFDNNADTFWEAELVTDAVVGYKDKYTGKQISVAEFNELINNEVNSPAVEKRSETVVTGETGSLIENYIPVSSVSAGTYLTCSMVVQLRTTRTINWISLNPNNFGQELYMEVVSIETSPNGKDFEELEGFDDHEFETMLTKDANSELNPREIQDTLSPDQFKYSGQGVWVFAPKETKAIKFDLRQTRGYLKLYEVLVCEIEQTVTTTTTTTKYWGLSKKKSTDSYTVRREVEIPYLTGHVVGFDAMSLEPGGIDSGKEKGAGKYAGEIAVGGLAAGALVGGALALSPLGPAGWIVGGAIALGALIYSFFAGTKKTETSVSPARISRQWTKIKNDKTRFAIGVRDVNLYSYKFAEKSDIISKPYLSPGPISKVALTVDETIPKIFYSDASRASTENDWIKYYISLNNGASWNRISPMHHRSTLSEDGSNNVPEIINVNSDLPAAERDNPLAYIDVPEAVYSIRFKASLSRPTDISEAESYTPVLSKYALQIYPAGGL